MNTEGLFLINRLSKEGVGGYLMEAMSEEIMKGSSFNLSCRYVPIHKYDDLFKENKTAHYFTTMQYLRFPTFNSTCECVRENLKAANANVMSVHDHLDIEYVLEIRPLIDVKLSKTDKELYDKLCDEDGKTMDFDDDSLHVTYRNINSDLKEIESVIDLWLVENYRSKQKCAIIIQNMDECSDNCSERVREFIRKYESNGHVIVNQNTCFINEDRYLPKSIGYAMNARAFEPAYK